MAKPTIAGCFQRRHRPAFNPDWADYNQPSTAFFQNVNKVLTGAESGKDAVDQVEQAAKRIVH
jgi:ABC-type glycerol-3-phosphate transport system substrate-binding protein